MSRESPQYREAIVSTLLPRLAADVREATTARTLLAPGETFKAGQNGRGFAVLPLDLYYRLADLSAGIEKWGGAPLRCGYIYESEPDNDVTYQTYRTPCGIMEGEAGRVIGFPRPADSVVFCFEETVIRLDTDLLSLPDEGFELLSVPVCSRCLELMIQELEHEERPYIIEQIPMGAFDVSPEVAEAHRETVRAAAREKVAEERERRRREAKG